MSSLGGGCTEPHQRPRTYNEELARKMVKRDKMQMDHMADHGPARSGGERDLGEVNFYSPQFVLCKNKSPIVLTYVKSRYQLVQIKHIAKNNSAFYPDIDKINARVLQGYIFGPLLFLIFVNNMTQFVPSEKLIA